MFVFNVFVVFTAVPGIFRGGCCYCFLFCFAVFLVLLSYKVRTYNMLFVFVFVFVFMLLFRVLLSTTFSYFLRWCSRA